MGDRADILLIRRLTNPAGEEKWELVDLHTHWHGSEFPHIVRELLAEAKKLAKDQLHWMTYPEILAAYLAMLDGLKCLEPALRAFPCHPDFYPRGDIRDTDTYSYILVLPERPSDGTLTYRLIQLEVGMEGFEDEDLELLREGRLDDVLAKYRVVRDETFTV